jgi:bacillithiol synthase
MNHAGILDAATTLVKVDYLPGGVLPERNMGAVGELPFDETLTQTFERLTAGLQKTEFTEPLLALLRANYTPGRTFNQAFAGWIGTLFREYGLVFISANDRRLKHLLSPLFAREIAEYPAVSQVVISQSAELEKGYHAQVKPRSVNLFMFHKGGRFLIEPREHDFSLKGTRHFIPKEEMLKVANETPELLSPNVILRPIAQDTLLPTVAYVAGPSEAAYHAQLRPVYEHFGVPQPVIYPRASVSFLEERLQRAMEKYELQLTDFFGDIDKVTSKVVERIAEVKLDVLFGNASGHIQDAMNEMRFGLNELDPTLIGALETALGKIETTIGVLKEKAVAAQKRRNETAVRQIEKSANGLLPNATLQERAVSSIYYLNRYGLELPTWMMERIDISGFKHQILTL